MTKKRAQPRQAFNIWLYPEVDGEAIAVLNHFRQELRLTYKEDSDHEINRKVFGMMARALAKNKRPDLLMPRENADEVLSRLAASMNEMSLELAEIRNQMENGIQVNPHNLDRMQQLANQVQPEERYTPFEESIGDSFVSFGDED